MFPLTATLMQQQQRHNKQQQQTPASSVLSSRAPIWLLHDQVGLPTDRVLQVAADLRPVGHGPPGVHVARLLVPVLEVVGPSLL